MSEDQAPADKNGSPRLLDYRDKLILAPMVRVNTLPMRLLALRFGADIVYTEELIDWKLMKCNRKVNEVLGTVDFVEDDGNIVFRTCPAEKDRLVLQIGTANAERALRAAKLVENDVSGIDVNMGCPKEFSVKGGMGVALASNIENAKKILTTLVSNLSIPVTCKIRIRKTTEETIEHVKELVSTGISAIAIHARTRDERPQHKPHPEVVKAVAEVISIPVICNGGSKEIDRHADIFKYKDQCGASSIMLARAAEWNVSIFRPKGLLPLMDVIGDYLKLAVDYDSYAANAKYCVQNMLRELQESEMGRKFLDAQTMEQICDVFELKDYCREKQAEFKKKTALLARSKAIDGEPNAKRAKLDDGTFEENITFIRSNYMKDVELPKSILHMHTKRKLRTVPSYVTEQQDRLFRSVLTLHDKKYMTSVWDKNKKSAEQAAAMVCLLHLGLMSKEELIENGSLNPFEL